MKVHEVIDWIGVDIFETLNTQFEDLKWQTEGNKDVAYGEVDGIKIKLILDPINFKEWSGMNLTFSVWDGKIYKETIGAIQTEKFAKIVGAITNAFKARVKDYDWDFLLLIAKDEVEKRMRLYTSIANRIFRELRLGINQTKRDGVGIIIIGRKGVDSQEILSKIDV